MDQPVLPDYAGACISNIVPGAARRPVEPPAWLPAAARRRRPGRAARARRPGLGAAPGAPATSRPRWRPWPAARSPPSRRPPPPPPSPRSPPACTPGEHGVVGYRIAVDGEVLNVLRWTTPDGDARQRDRPRARSSRPRRSAASGRAVVTKAEFATLRLHRRPPRRRPLQRLPRAVDAGRRGPHGCCGPASRSSTPTTTASTRSPTSTASASTTTPSCRRRPAGRPTCSRCCRRDAALVVTADHGQVDVGDNIVELAPRRAAPTCRSSRARAGSAGCTPARAGPTPCSRRPGPTTATPAWVRTRDEIIDEGWFGPTVTDAARPASATWPSWPVTPVSLRRPRRHRPVRADRPPRLADAGRDAACRCSSEPTPDGAMPSPTPAARPACPTSVTGPVEHGRAAPAERRRAAGARRRARSDGEAVEEPAKVMRIGSMIKQLLDEVRSRRARRAGPRPARGDLRHLASTSSARPCRPTCAPSSSRLGPPVRRRRRPERRRAAHRPGPAGGLARGPVPRHPGHAVRPADGGPPAAGGDARPAARRAPRPGAAGRRPPRHLPVSRAGRLGARRPAGRCAVRRGEHVRITAV